MKRGHIATNSRLLLGPDIGDGQFKATAVKSIHYKRLPVAKVVAGQTAALALKKVRRGEVRKGTQLPTQMPMLTLTTCILGGCDRVAEVVCMYGSMCSSRSRQKALLVLVDGRWTLPVSNELSLPDQPHLYQAHVAAGAVDLDGACLYHS